MSARTWFSRGGWRRRGPGGGLLGDDLAAKLDALVADRDAGGRAAHDRGDVVARLAAERAAQLPTRWQHWRSLEAHARNATAGTVRG